MTGGTAAQGDALERFIRETEPAAAFEADMSSDDEASVVGVADPAAERALLKQLRAERRAVSLSHRMLRSPDRQTLTTGPRAQQKLQRQGGTWACMRSAPFEKTDEPIGVNARIIEEVSSCHPSLVISARALPADGPAPVPTPRRHL
jgi:hypothetical protein